MSKISEKAVLEIIGIADELHEAANLTAFLNCSAVELSVKGATCEKETLGLQYCFFNLEKKIESAADRIHQLRECLQKRGNHDN